MKRFSILLMGVCALFFINSLHAEKWTSDYAVVGASSDSPFGRFLVKDAQSGETLARFDGTFVQSPSKAQWTTCVNLAPFKGRELKFCLYEDGSAEKSRPIEVEPSESWSFKTDSHSEKFRPKFHFTAPVGWLNDPNGLVYIDGTWYLFFQYSPFSLRGSFPKLWGLAKSVDLVNWTQLGVALWANGNSQMYSGSACVDFENKSGIFSSKKGGVILALTDTVFGETLYSTQDMKSFAPVEFNPILPPRTGVVKSARDPRIFFNDESGLWTIVRYEGKKDQFTMGIYVSKDLRDWICADEVDGFYECPDFSKVKVENGEGYKWLLFDASFNYAIGDFDGRVFHEDTKRDLSDIKTKKDVKNSEKLVSRRVVSGDIYAAQIFSNVPDGRKVAVSWLRIKPSEVEKNSLCFSQCMSVPYEVSVALKNGSYVMKARPSAEILNAFGEEKSALGELEISPDSKEAKISDSDFRGKLLRAKIKASPNSKVKVSLSPFGDFSGVSGADGSLDIAIFVDALSAEAFFGDGDSYQAKTAVAKKKQTLSFSSSAPIKVEKLTLSDLK